MGNGSTNMFGVCVLVSLEPSVLLEKDSGDESKSQPWEIAGK